jgi:hypothetical protein
MMAMDERPGGGKSEKSRLMWIVGFVLLAIVAVIAVRAFLHGTNVPTQQNAGQPGYSEADREAAGVKVENGTAQ